MTTQAPDAPRLVPVEPTPKMINAAWVTFRNSSWHELSPSDIDRNVGTGAFREAWSAMLAAAPAVQPAAGMEEIAALMREPMVAVTSLDGTVREPLVCLTVDERDAILAAISTPAQASESGGEDSAFKVASDLHAAYEQLIYGLPKYLEAENLTDEENMIREAYITLDVTAHRLAALSAPQDAPGEGEQS